MNNPVLQLAFTMWKSLEDKQKYFEPRQLKQFHKLGGGGKLTVKKIYDSTSALRLTPYSSQIQPCKEFLTRSHPERSNNITEGNEI